LARRHAAARAIRQITLESQMLDCKI